MFGTKSHQLGPGSAHDELGDAAQLAEFAVLTETAAALGAFDRVLLLRREGEQLVGYPPAPAAVRLPLRGTFSGSCAQSGRAGVAAVAEEQLHPRERALLVDAGCEALLVAPLSTPEGGHSEGVVLGLKRGPLGGLEQRVLALTAQQAALRWQVRALSEGFVTQRALVRAHEDAVNGLLGSMRSAALLLDDHDRLLAANRAAEVLLGFDLGTASGQTLGQVVQAPALVGLVAGTHGTGGGPLPEVRLGDHRSMVFEVRITPIFARHGQLLWRVVALYDATSFREADELKTEFVSMVSHELRTPLTSIKAFASTLLRDEQATPEEQHEWLRIIDRECDRLAALINDLLTISRLESGRPLQLNLGEFDLMALLRDVAEVQQAAARKHTVAVRGPAALLVEGDAERLRQVAVNLVNNAVKYSPRGGEVIVEVEEAEDAVQFAVSDQGVGIRPEHLELVFEKFFQVDGGTTRRVGGSGLGLYLSRRLVEAHGGSMAARSEWGRGTTMTATVPRRAPRGEPVGTSER